MEMMMSTRSTITSTLTSTESTIGSNIRDDIRDNIRDDIRDDRIDVKVATITLTTQLPNCELHLINIGKYLEIDDEIIGIKYNYAKMSIIKGKYLTTIYKKCKMKDECKINKVLFYNQVSLIVNNRGHDINVKLFKNGSLHLTGCKDVKEGVEVTKIIYNKLDNIRKMTDTILLVKDVNDVLLDKDNFIYSYTKGAIIGYMDMEKGDYIINKKNYTIDEKTEMFISSKIEKQRKRTIYNLDGEIIGYSQIQLINNRNKFYKKNTNSVYCDMKNDLIYYNNDILIGKIVYNVEASNITQTGLKDDIMEVKYYCNPFMNCDYKIDLNTDVNFNDMFNLNVNCINVYFNLKFMINRQRLYERLLNMHYICKYNPETYSGVKLIYKIPLDTKNKIVSGICHCSTKCTCLNVTFLIFQSGNVICTGLRSMEECNNITSYFINILMDIKDSVQKRVLIKI
jgi:TATA-box binding protein (TBP) (component of TFIID and TFIIIB)